MTIRDRIKELRRVPAATLKPHPLNWRTHPQKQRALLEGVLAEVGYADALLARELPDGTLELIDGHLRAETTPEAEVPVLVVDLNDEEAAKLLALHDSIASLAEANADNWNQLTARFETDQQSIAAFLQQRTVELSREIAPEVDSKPHEIKIEHSFQVIVQCGDEEQQRDIYERLTLEGLRCRVLTL